MLGAAPLPDEIQVALNELPYGEHQSVLKRFAYEAAASVFADKTPFVEATAGVRKMLRREKLGFEDILVPEPRGTPTLEQLTPPLNLPENDVTPYGTTAFRDLAHDYQASFLRVANTSPQEVKQFVKTVKGSCGHKPRYLAQDDIARQNLQAGTLGGTLPDSEWPSELPAEDMSFDIEAAWEEINSTYTPAPDRLRPQSFAQDSYWYLIGSSLVALSYRIPDSYSRHPLMILFPMSGESEAHLRDQYRL